MTPEDVLSRTIMLFEYGSRAHGTHTEFSDQDRMGIAVEPQEYVIGLNSWDQLQTSTAIKNERSTSVDTDTTIYSLKKWARLAAKGNPTVLTALFAPHYEILADPFGTEILAHQHAFISKEAGERFLGYMISQRHALLGLKNKKTNRPELIHTFGFDTKFAYHMMRLGLQGIELMTNHTISLPMLSDQRDYLLSIRNGDVTKDDVMEQACDIEARLKEAIAMSTLPEQADSATINKLVVNTYQLYWTEHDK
jgi:predicted nucleotidyltransferase